MCSYLPLSSNRLIVKFVDTQSFLGLSSIIAILKTIYS